ncbi:MAG: hypothetical protein J6X84_00250 [Treponema sp.]|nr:hypothetical protein [Treponema sp.]
MKKCVFLFLCLFCVFGSAFAQKSAGTANKNTALRCLKLAENCLVAKDWKNALSQAELGLSYDDSISDLYYVKAAATLNLGGTKAQSLRFISSAFERNNWAGYTKNGARIFIADLLSDTGLYDQSLSILDSDPFIYSADAEFIRIKNYYRLGTSESVNNARLRLNSDRRVYPQDSRFPELFFMFESLFRNEAEKNGISYEIPEIVSTIADAYIFKLPDYSDKNPQMELLAAGFARDEEKLRLIKSIEAKHKNINALLAVSALRAGIYSDQQAFDMFFSAVGKQIPLELLESFISLLSDEAVIQQAAELLADFSGTIFIDDNLDLQYEFTVIYEKGRPLSINYDSNNDGEVELYCSCDFGSPVFISFNSRKTQFFYDTFPSVSKIAYTENNLVFNFQHNDLTFSPFDFVIDNTFSRIGADFYIPYIAHEVAITLPQEAIKSASSFELPITERDDARIVYSLSGGELVFAEFFEQNKRYAYCQFNDETSITRYVDYDNNGIFETTELYTEIPFGQQGLDTDENRQIVSKAFNFIDGRSNLYLRKIQIDDNSNTFCEFSEEYLEYNGKITVWDNDDNGIPDCQYIRYPQKPGESLVEETLYFDDNGLQKLSLTTYDGVPVKLNSEGSEVMVYAGNTENLYWIETKGSADAEAAVLKFVASGITQGAISIFDFENQRISVIKVESNLYCRYVPANTLPLVNEASK